MRISNFTFKGEEDTDIYVYKYEPKIKENIKGIVQISHGMSEEAKRYEMFASFLNKNGYIVYVNDHRGHGKTAKTVENVGYLAKENGFYHLVEDMNILTNIIKNENLYNSLYEKQLEITKNLDYDFIFDKIKELIFEEIYFYI